MPRGVLNEYEVKECPGGTEHLSGHLETKSQESQAPRSRESGQKGDERLGGRRTARRVRSPPDGEERPGDAEWPGSRIARRVPLVAGEATTFQDGLYWMDLHFSSCLRSTGCQFSLYDDSS